MEKKYFRLQFKSIMKVFPTILVITVITLLSVALLCGLALKKDSDSSDKQKISVAIVGSLENTYLDIGFYALKNLDSSRFYFEFLELDEEEAIKKLQAREISGYLRIPDDFVKSIARGENKPAEYITLNTPDNFGTILTEEVTMMISDMLTHSQVGMYSMQDVARKYNKKDLGKNIDNLTVNYVNYIFNRQTVYNLSLTGLPNSLSLGGYYICGLFMLFILLWGISCNRIFASKNLAFSRVLKVSGVSSGKQIICEYGAYLSVTIITMLLFSLIFGVVTQFVKLPVRELEGISIVDPIFFVVATIPVVAMVLMMQFAFYEMIPNKVGSVLMQFILAIGLGYISGCFYPNYFFPESVQVFAGYLPVGVGFSFLRKVMSGVFPVTELVLLIAYGVAFLLIAIKVRNYRMEGGSI